MSGKVQTVGSSSSESNITVQPQAVVGQDFEAVQPNMELTLASLLEAEGFSGWLDNTETIDQSILGNDTPMICDAVKLEPAMLPESFDPSMLPESFDPFLSSCMLDNGLDPLFPLVEPSVMTESFDTLFPSGMWDNVTSTEMKVISVKEELDLDPFLGFSDAYSLPFGVDKPDLEEIVASAVTAVHHLSWSVFERNMNSRFPFCASWVFESVFNGARRAVVRKSVTVQPFVSSISDARQAVVTNVNYGKTVPIPVVTSLVSSEYLLPPVDHPPEPYEIVEISSDSEEEAVDGRN
jgi:hypothetical protein